MKLPPLVRRGQADDCSACEPVDQGLVPLRSIGTEDKQMCASVLDESLQDIRRPLLA
jgi:hypothetical protein